MTRLTVELVPDTCWYTNVRSNVTRAEWEKCKRFVKKRSGERCEICGGRGSRYPVDCHEVWSYDNLVQRLEGLIALCPRCHEVKHLGRAEATGNLERAVTHLQRVNGWDDDTTYEYVVAAFARWRYRSQFRWTLDISWLETLGIDPDANPNVVTR